MVRIARMFYTAPHPNANGVLPHSSGSP
jgi:hypothetical protein